MMAGSPFRFRNMALVLAAGSFLAAAAVQACSPGTLEDSGAYKAQVDMYAPSTGSGGGGSVGTGGGGSVATGGKVGVGTGGSAPSGATCGPMNVPSSCATATAALEQCKACHDSAGAKTFATLDFFTDPKTALVGKPALYTGGPTMCPAEKEMLLDPNPANFEKSLLVTKTRGIGFACGLKMPYPTGVFGQATDKDCILAWACGLIKP